MMQRLDSTQADFAARLAQLTAWEEQLDQQVNTTVAGIIADIAAQEHPTYDNQLTFSPVATSDLARVVAAIIDQLSAGANLAGIFHYCSGDRATAYDFAETVLAAANQYLDCGDFRPAPSDEDQHSKLIRVLDCSRLRDSFAIKQMPWRGFVSAEVEAVFEQP